MRRNDYVQIIWDKRKFLRSFEAVVGLRIKLIVAKKGSMKKIVANGVVLRKKVIIKIKDPLAARDNLNFRGEPTNQALLGGRLLGLYFRIKRFKLSLALCVDFWKRSRTLLRMGRKSFLGNVMVK